eukprot:1155998-Pelagomonas_calceolata.AAC.1
MEAAAAAAAAAGVAAAIKKTALAAVGGAAVMKSEEWWGMVGGRGWWAWWEQVNRLLSELHLSVVQTWVGSKAEAGAAAAGPPTQLDTSALPVLGGQHKLRWCAITGRPAKAGVPLPKTSKPTL